MSKEGSKLCSLFSPRSRITSPREKIGLTKQKMGTSSPGVIIEKSAENKTQQSSLKLSDDQ
jgi:hypothetical protein